MIRPLDWSACTHAPISLRVNWNRPRSMTSPACGPIWMRSPTSKGRRQMMNAHPAVYEPQDEVADQPESGNRPRGNEQPRLELGAHAEVSLEPVDHEVCRES